MSCDCHVIVYTSTRIHTSLVPRPHPLMRRNGLVNQVEFLGLAGVLATVYLSNIQNNLRKTHSKKVQILEWRCINFNVVREVLRNNYRSRNLIGLPPFWGISPRNSTLFTRLFLARLVTRLDTHIPGSNLAMYLSWNRNLGQMPLFRSTEIGLPLMQTSPMVLQQLNLGTKYHPCKYQHPHCTWFNPSPF